MKRILNKLMREEAGQAFILALIMLLLGGLIIAPLLGFMGTGLKSGQAYEKRMTELYAADAGVADALWQIQTRADGLPTDVDPGPLPYTMADVNDKQVDYTIEYKDDHTYKITSTGTTTDVGSKTTIESYIVVEDYGFLLDSAITSNTDVEIGSNSEVKGDIRCPEDELYLSPTATWDDEEYDQNTDPIPEEDWPKKDGLIWFYEQDVDTSDLYPDETIDVNLVGDDPYIIGPLYREGDLDIYSSKVDEPARLDGTVYVTGDLRIGKTNKPFILNLNGNTIFVESDSDVAIDIGGNCTLIGSGCIVAIGGIKAYPHIISEEGDFLLIMSVEGVVDLQPIGTFYGAIVGDATVDMQPNCYLEWVEPPTGEDAVNFPWEGYEGDKVLTEIRTWEIDLQ